MAIVLTGFEVLIEVLQAYIFTLLAALYINDAVERTLSHRTTARTTSSTR